MDDPAVQRLPRDRGWLAALRDRLPSVPRTRFAPAPTGYLHLGHAVNAVYVWGMARALGGRVLLRIEDHDRGRCRPEYDRAMLEDLAWLGLVPDEGPVRQSDDATVYQERLARLDRQRQVYVCDCSRRNAAICCSATATATGPTSSL